MRSRKYRSKFKSYAKKSLGTKRLIILTYLASFALISLILGSLSLIIVFAYFSRDLPSPDRLLERNEELSTKLLDRNGKLLYEVFGQKNRTLVTYDQVSSNVIHATLATEDADFYLHQGFSIRGIARAVRNTLTGEGLQGGSTLTQQVVKNALLTQDRTIVRKIKELILSLQLENRYPKDQIIQMYLNETPYGGQSYGILTAAKAYFNKLPSELTVAESAYLAGLPQRPSYYSHYGSTPEAGIERKNYVLWLMNQRGWTGSDGKRYYLSDEDYIKAKDEELRFQASAVSLEAPHFVFYVKQLLADQFGEEMVDSGGLQVTTTLDLDLQNTAQQIVTGEIDNAKKLNVGNGALVAIDPKTGQILSMIGSKGYFMKSEPEGCVSGTVGENSCTFEPNLNVTLAKRQPGSSIKPITYATMLTQGYTASFPLIDVPTVFEGATPEKPYIPENYDGKFRGVMSLRKSLGNSLNIPAVKSLKIVGIDNMINMAQKLGITTLTERSRYGLSLTLGGGETRLLEMTGAYASLANKGVHYNPVAILEVKDSKGNILYKWHDTGGEQAVGADVAFLLSDILSDDGARSEAFGFNSLLNIPGYQVAAKTGTTDDKRDNYAMGYTPSIAVGVWVGNNNNDKMNPVLSSGISGATPIWHRFMQDYLKNKTPEKFIPPENVEKMTVDSLTGMLPFETNATRSEWFIKGTAPSAQSTWYQKLEICKLDGKLANDSCKKAGETKIKTYIKITAALPEWQDDVDKWVWENYKGKDEYFPPQTTSHLEFDSDGKVINSNKVYVDIVGLKDNDLVPLSFRLPVEVSSDNDIKKVRIYQNDNQITADSSEPYGYNFNFAVSQAGTYTFKVVAEDSKGNKGEKTVILLVGIAN